MNNDDRIDPRYAQSKQHAEHAARFAQSEYAKFRQEQQAKHQGGMACMDSKAEVSAAIEAQLKQQQSAERSAWFPPQFNSSLEQSASEPRQPYGQITEQVEYLENALVAQYGIIELLAEKMRPFLGNDNTCQTGTPASETLSCPMANMLRTVFERLDSHNMLLNHLIDSIET